MQSDKALLIGYVSQFDSSTFSYEFDENECLTARFVTSAITKPHCSNEPAFCNSLLDSGTPHFGDDTPVARSVVHRVIVATERLAIPVQWQAGDVLMLDNLRLCMDGANSQVKREKFSCGFLILGSASPR